jgi:hypothetical protein
MTLYVASQRVFIIIVIYFVMTQSGKFWIHPHVAGNLIVRRQEINLDYTDRKKRRE